MPSGTGVIGPSGVLTGSFSVGRKHVPSDNYRDETSDKIKHSTYILPSPPPVFDISQRTCFYGNTTLEDGDIFTVMISPGTKVTEHEFKLFNPL